MFVHKLQQLMYLVCKIKYFKWHVIMLIGCWFMSLLLRCLVFRFGTSSLLNKQWHIPFSPVSEDCSKVLKRFVSLPPTQQPSVYSEPAHECVTFIHLNNECMETKWKPEEQRSPFCCRGRLTHTHLTHTSAVFQVCTVWPLKWVGVCGLQGYSVVEPKVRVDKLSSFPPQPCCHTLVFLFQFDF